VTQERTIQVCRKAFTLFQKEFLRWQQKQGLTEYGVTFRFEPIDGSYADITTSRRDKFAVVRLSSQVTVSDMADLDPARSAKHEAIHLLLARMVWLAESRYVHPQDIDVVRRLEAAFGDGVWVVLPAMLRRRGVSRAVLAVRKTTEVCS